MAALSNTVFGIQDVNNLSTEHDLFSTTISGGTFTGTGAAGMLVRTALMKFSNTTGATKSATIRFYLGAPVGGTKIYQDDISLPNDSEKQPWLFRLFVYTGDGAGSEAADKGNVFIESVPGYIGSTPNTGVGKLTNSSASIVAVTAMQGVDSTVDWDNNVDIRMTVQFSAASVNLGVSGALGHEVLVDSTAGA